MNTKVYEKDGEKRVLMDMSKEECDTLIGLTKKAGALSKLRGKLDKIEVFAKEDVGDLVECFVVAFEGCEVIKCEGGSASIEFKED